MTEKDRQIELKVGDRVIELNSSDKGTITRLGADKDIVFVRWDSSKEQLLEKWHKLHPGDTPLSLANVNNLKLGLKRPWRDSNPRPAA